MPRKLVLWIELPQKAEQGASEYERLGQQMDALAREIVGLKRDDPRRAEIIAEISRLSLRRVALSEQIRNPRN